MRHVVHHAIVVTSYDGGRADKARRMAVELDCSVTPLIQSNVNDDWTFLVGPDCSKSGWSDSDEGDARRDEFVEWLRSHRFDDGSSPYQWVEVSYSSDDEKASIVRHEWKRGAPHTESEKR